MASNPPREEPVGEHFKNGQRRHRDHETESNTKQKFIRPGAEVRQHVFSTEQNIQRYQPDASHDQGRARINVASPFSLPDPAGLDRDLSLSNIPEPLRHLRHLQRQVLFNNLCDQASVAFPQSEEEQYRIEQKKILARRTLTIIANETGVEDKVVERILDSFEKELTTFFANHLI